LVCGVLSPPTTGALPRNLSACAIGSAKRKALLVTMVQGLQHRASRLEDLALPQHPGSVVLVELVAQGRIGCLPRCDAKGHGQHAARPGSGMGSQFGKRQWRARAPSQHVVHRAGEVGGTVDERAVKVEQHCGDAGTHVGPAPFRPACDRR
jgi:hypothetical protein